MKKRGLELAISTLIIIILGIIILLALSLAFTGGFKKFWEQVTNFFPSDISTVKNACQAACTSEQAYDFCIRERNVKELGKITCEHEVVNVSCEIVC